MTLTVPTTGMCEHIAWRGHARLDKRLAGEPMSATPYEVVEAENMLLTPGATALLTALTGGSITAFSTANARLCVGNGSTAVAAGQTDLTGASKTRKAVDSAPLVSGRSVQFVATFLSAEANHDWTEAGVANAASGGTLLNRFLQAFGEKTSALQWTLTITCTL